MTEEAQRFIEALKEYGAILTGPAGAAAGFIFARRRANAEATKMEADADVVQSDALTRQFQALVDGYERRVADLTAEVEVLRAEVKALRKVLDERART